MIAIFRTLYQTDQVHFVLLLLGLAKYQFRQVGCVIYVLKCSVSKQNLVTCSVQTTIDKDKDSILRTDSRKIFSPFVLVLPQAAVLLCDG